MDHQQRSQAVYDDPHSEPEATQSDMPVVATPAETSPPEEMRTAEHKRLSLRSVTGAIRNTRPEHIGAAVSQTFRNPTKHRLQALGVAASALLLVVLLLTMIIRYNAMQTEITAFRVGQQQTVTQNIGGGGIIYANQRLDLTYPAPEHITAVLVKAGDVVKVNQPLIKLDPTQLNAQITQASDNVAAAQSYLYSVSNAFPYNAVAVAAAQHALQLAQSHYNSLVSQASSSTLHNGNLIAPFNGIISMVNVNPGQIVAANTIILTLTDQSSVIVHAEIPLINQRQVSLGMNTTVTPSALPDLTLQGKVTAIIPTANPQTDTFEVWVTVPNAQETLLPGMSAFVNIQSQQKAFAVPRLAVMNPDHEASVFQIVNGRASIKPVHVVGRSETEVYLDLGVSPNDLIVLLPLDKILHDGQQINVVHIEQ
ncbi:MAG TPA: efflux RND transporter periplasmic adaptor subunit [Ktedonobacteraceae bacterium]|nr:efflux RND transporter periplasmic adaptor subunit [Ktedonobacteraceae bacterium]